MLLVHIKLIQILFDLFSVICLILFVLPLLSYHFLPLIYLLLDCISVCFLIAFLKIIILVLEFIKQMIAFSWSNKLLNFTILILIAINKYLPSSLLLILNSVIVFFSSLNLVLFEQSIMVTHLLILVLCLLILHVQISFLGVRFIQTLL